MARAATAVTLNDIMPMDDFMRTRLEKRAKVMETKSQRRIAVGPYAVFLFECFETIWWQIHEMLRIEEGGKAQALDEIDAYAPLVPDGDTLKATLMFEIGSVPLRKKLLQTWGHIEKHIFMEVGGVKVAGTAIEDDERTTPDGKTSAVHFIQFHLDANIKKAFKDPDAQTTLGFSHPEYNHQAVLSEKARDVLAQDLV